MRHGLHAVMRFHDPADPIEDQCLRGMEACEIGRASRRVMERNAKHGVAFGQTYGLLQKAGGLRR